MLSQHNKSPVQLVAERAPSLWTAADVRSFCGAACRRNPRALCFFDTENGEDALFFRPASDFPQCPLYYLVDPHWAEHQPIQMDRQMNQVESAIREKPDWERKVFDDAICAKWYDEVASGNESRVYGHTWTSEYWRRVVDELRAEAGASLLRRMRVCARRHELGADATAAQQGALDIEEGMAQTCVESVWAYDLVSPPVRAAANAAPAVPVQLPPSGIILAHHVLFPPGDSTSLLATHDLYPPGSGPAPGVAHRELYRRGVVADCALALVNNARRPSAHVAAVVGQLHDCIDALYAGMDKREESVHWQPNSDQQVFNVCHPSLFCFVTEWSRLRAGAVAGIAARNMVIDTGRGFYRRPGVSDQFQWLPSEFGVDRDGSVHCLSYINNVHPKHVAIYRSLEDLLALFVPLFNQTLSTALTESHAKTRFETGRGYRWYREPSFQWKPWTPPGKEQEHKSEDNTDEEEEEDEDALYERWRAARTFHMPDLLPMPKCRPSRPSVDLRGRRIQVITKIARIVLTPEKPQYNGGVWHVEGMENERIVATGIYYSRHENIVESSLSFRAMRCDPDYEQGDDDGVQHLYGLADEDVMNLFLGQVDTKAGRFLCFPNVFQHKVSAFQLADPSLSGFREIVVFFLVDPKHPVLSTAHVAPQQWPCPQVEIVQALASVRGVEPVTRLVCDYLDEQGTMPEARAREFRAALMDERRKATFFVNEEYFEREFSLCEH